MTKIFQSLSFFVALGILLAIGPISYASATEGVLFVSPTGNDSNSCLSVNAPCFTLQAAVNKALPGDHIKVGIGDYPTISQMIPIEKSLTISGGWNSTFDLIVGKSTVTGNYGFPIFMIEVGVEVHIETLIIQKGETGIINLGNLTLIKSIVRDNSGQGMCYGGGIHNSQQMILEYTTISNNSCNGGWGGGIYNAYSADYMIISNSTIENNIAQEGGGIASNANLTIINSTISNNTSLFGHNGAAGVAQNSGFLVLKNVTITRNIGSRSGGGINNGGLGYVEIRISNSILSGNAGYPAADCSGEIISEGYNIIGDTDGCNFIKAVDDQLDIDPLIGPLQYNGGETQTHLLFKGSPAIDRGNPIGCDDEDGELLLDDQRGYKRPVPGTNNEINNYCDIGAVEVSNTEAPLPPPIRILYVSKYGNDNSNCLNPTTPCLSINAAVEKAGNNDSVYISADSFVCSSGIEVVNVNKNIKLLGGWNNDFSKQTSYSIIDGDFRCRGITVDDSVVTKINRIIIQNGVAPYGEVPYMGGGILIGAGTKVEISDSKVTNNSADKYDPIYGFGGGIGIYSTAKVKIINSFIQNNSAYGCGGGIFVPFSSLQLIDSTVENNIARKGGGICGKFDPRLQIENTRIVINKNIVPTDNGGGIFLDDGYIVLSNSIVQGNTSAGNGGGLAVSSGLIENCVIDSNQGRSGGGIYSRYEVLIKNSSISNNIAIDGQGGGLYASNKIFLLNTTLYGNQAYSENTSMGMGGGIYSQADFKAKNVTITKNIAERNGGGFFTFSSWTSFENSIIAGNFANMSPDCGNSIFSLGFNLVGNKSGCDFNPTLGDLVNVSPKFGFQFGWPPLFPLLPDSPAIDKGNADGCLDFEDRILMEDQLKTVRPQDGNEDGLFVCDIGAFEYDPKNPPRYIFLPIIRH
jgi:hypothetical protein